MNKQRLTDIIYESYLNHRFGSTEVKKREILGEIYAATVFYDLSWSDIEIISSNIVSKCMEVKDIFDRDKMKEAIISVLDTINIQWN